MILLKRRVWLGLALALLAAACGGKAPEPRSAFDGFTDDLALARAHDDPELATIAGLSEDVAGEGFAKRLLDRSADAVDRRRAGAFRDAAEIAGFDRGALSPEDRTTYDALAVQLGTSAKAAAFSFGRFDGAGVSPYVVNPFDAAFAVLPDFFANRLPVAKLVDARDYVARLHAVGPAIDAETRAAQSEAVGPAHAVPPDFLIDRALAVLDPMVAGGPDQLVYITALKSKLAALVGPLEPPADEKQPTLQLARARALVAEAEAAARDEIAPALTRAASALRALRPYAVHAAGVGRLPQGPQYYAAALALATTDDKSPDEILEIGQRAVAAATAELDGALREMGKTEGSEALRAALVADDPANAFANDEAGRAARLADAQARLRWAIEQAPSWFGELPRAKLTLAPDLSYGTGGRRYLPPSLDGSRPAVESLDLDGPRGLSKVDAPTADFAFGAPGRHLQIALAQEPTELPLVRRLVRVPAFNAGWALYAQQLMDEAGVYQQPAAKLGRIGYLRERLRRAAEMVADVRVHAKGWTREDAVAYLVQTTGDSQASAGEAVDRIVAWPGRAAAPELGRAAIEAARAAAQRALGPKFTLRRFHETLLGSGDPPLPTLPALSARYVRLAEAGR